MLYNTMLQQCSVVDNDTHCQLFCSSCLATQANTVSYNHRYQSGRLMEKGQQHAAKSLYIDISCFTQQCIQWALIDYVVQLIRNYVKQSIAHSLINSCIELIATIATMQAVCMCTCLVILVYEPCTILYFINIVCKVINFISFRAISCQDPESCYDLTSVDPLWAVLQAVGLFLPQVSMQTVLECIRAWLGGGGEPRN